MNNKELLYENGLKNQKENEIQREVLAFHKKNNDKIALSYQAYKQYCDKPEEYIEEPKAISKDAFLELLKEKSILIITANKVEEAVFLFELCQFTSKKISYYEVEDVDFHVAYINEYAIIHKHSGGTGEEPTRVNLNDATRIFTPTYLILLGVCYGIDNINYSIGNVIISNSVWGYKINFRDSETEDVSYDVDIEYTESPSRTLIDRISRRFSCMRVKNHSFSTSIRDEIVKVYIGKYISANCLMSSKKVKRAVIDSINKSKPKALAGEMEACSIFKSNFFIQNPFNNWLVIKSICDWGEGKNMLSPDPQENDKIKDGLQTYAMVNSWETLRFILEKNTL